MSEENLSVGDIDPKGKLTDSLSAAGRPAADNLLLKRKHAPRRRRQHQKNLLLIVMNVMYMLNRCGVI